MAERSRGFTLLEMLVVVLIVGLIGIALTSGVHFAGRAWEAQERQMDRQGDFGAVLSAVREIVVSGHTFEGDGQSVKFVGQLPKGLNRGGLYDIELHVDAGRFLLSWKPHFKGTATQVSPTDTELIKGVSAIELSYYTEGEWRSEAKDQKPSLIRVVLVSTNGGRWPQLVVAPMIDANPDGSK